MPADYLILQGDMIMWMPTFGPAITTGPPMGVVQASSAVVKCCQRPIALFGDERRWMSLPIAYTSASFTIPGLAIAKVMMLGPDQTTKIVKIEGKPAIIKGSMFTAILMVTAPAMMPTPGGPVPDPVPMYPGGMGKLITTNVTVKAG